MQGLEIRAKLKNGQRVYGTNIVSLGNPVAARMNTDLEIDFVFICTEHMPLDRTEVSMMCQYYAAKGISPVVRIPYPSAHWATMAIDAGAEGIVAPYVETTEQVKEMVGAVRYRPIKGKFLNDILEGKRKPAEKMQKFWGNFNRNTFLIIGIESTEAIDRLEELISNDGVDGVFLGPHDITCSMEIPEEYENPKFIDTVKDIVKRCRKLGKGVGIHSDLTADKCREFLDTDMNFMLHLADVVKMRDTMNSEFRAMREKFGDVYEKYTAENDQKSCIE